MLEALPYIMLHVEEMHNVVKYVSFIKKICTKLLQDYERVLLIPYAVVQILISRGANLKAENANRYITNSC